MSYAHRISGVLLGLIAAVLVGCAVQPGAGVSPTSPVTSSTGGPSSPSVSDVPRFRLECLGIDGRALGPFTRLEEAWASPNYVRIDNCTASARVPGSVELTSDEESVAEIAAADLPDKDPVDLFLWTLATCVRVTPTSTESLAGLPTSLLQAALELCPEAPHIGLMEAELDTRGQLPDVSDD